MGSEAQSSDYIAFKRCTHDNLVAEITLTHKNSIRKGQKGKSRKRNEERVGRYTVQTYIRGKVAALLTSAEASDKKYCH